jgi:hypothetical protein
MIIIEEGAYMRIGSVTTAGEGPESVAGGARLILEKLSSPNTSKDWSAVLQQTLERVRGQSQKPSTVAQHMQQMSELLKTQSDISRYQLKVELISKVSEGAVASIRKLQQNQ